MVLFYLIGWLAVATPFCLLSWLGLIWYRNRSNTPGYMLWVGLGSGPFACFIVVAGWAFLTVALAPSGDPPIGAGVALILGEPAVLISFLLAIVLGITNGSEQK